MAASDPLILFLLDEGHDHRHRTLAEILAWDDSALERTHDYIQWLFPLPEASRFSLDAPVLNAAAARFIGSNAKARRNLLAARDRMLDFYQGNRHWLVPFDHNHLRITRIIRCLALCLGEEEARGFHEIIMQLVEAGKVELDAPVQRYVPDFRVDDAVASAQITVRNLLLQTSGLPVTENSVG